MHTDFAERAKYISMKNEFQRTELFKGALSGLRQVLITESPLKMMKNAFYVTSKALFILKNLRFCHHFLVT